MFNAIIGIVATVATAASGANQGAADATPTPEVVYPIVRPAETSGPIQIQIDAPKSAWGLRKAAREDDRLLKGVRIHTHGKCSDRPRALCVKVTVGDFGEGWYALTSFPKIDKRTIQFNTHYTDYKFHAAAAAHEFGHVLGLGHHLMHGVDGRFPNELHLSKSELHVLRAAYLVWRG